MFLLINIFVMATLIFVLLVILTRNDFWTRLIGEIYHGIGIALMAGSTIGYFMISNLEQFLSLFILGIVSLIIGIALILTSELLLVNSQGEMGTVIGI